MKTVKNKLAQIGAITVLSAIALVGCSSASSNSEQSSTEATIENQQETQKTATTEEAADYANEFFAELLSADTTDYSKLKLPVDLNEDQMEQLMFDGKVKNVSEDKISELVDFLYANKSIAKFVYVADNVPDQEKMQILSVLTISQSFASEMSEEQSPEKVTADDVIIEDRSGVTYATFGSGEDILAPRLIFVDGEWKVDGEDLLASMMNQAESAQN